MDLEQYGVWVKAGPEDATDESEEMFALSDVADDVDESSFEDDRGLTSEEEHLLASLEEEDDSSDGLDASDFERAAAEEAAVAETDEEAFSFDDTGEELDETLSLDDFSIDDIESELEANLAAEAPDSGSTAGTADSSLDEEFSIDLDDEEFTIDSAESTAAPDAAVAPEPLSEDVDALDIDIDTIPADEPAADISEAAFDLDDTGEELPELDLDEGFDDVEAVTAEMLADVPTERHEPEALSGIEHELASIKTELQALKEELAELRKAGPAAGPISTPAPTVEEPQVDAGFFEEDEDEKIALTGDELDNILNTAEFTEELGKPSEVDDIDLNLDGDLDAGDEGQADDESIDEIILEEMDDTHDELDLDSINLDSGLDVLDDSLTPGAQDEEITLGDEGDIDTDLLLSDEDDLSEQHGRIDEPDEEPAHTPGESPFSGSLDAVQELADMDIDSELAGIEELSDEESDADYTPDAPTASDTLEDELELNLDSDEEIGALELSLDDDEAADEEAFSPLDDLSVTGDDEEAEEALALEDDDLGIDLNSDEAEEPFSVGEEVLVPSFAQRRPDDDGEAESLPSDLRDEIRSVLKYMDQLLESLPEEKIEEFARSEHFDVYKRLFEELGLET